MNKELPSSQVPVNWLLLINSHTLMKIVQKTIEHVVLQINEDDNILILVLPGATYFGVDFSRNFPYYHEIIFLQNLNFDISYSKKIIVLDTLYSERLKIIQDKLHDSVIVTCLSSIEDKNIKIGVVIPNVKLVGYGLEHDNKYSNLINIYAIHTHNTLHDVLFGNNCYYRGIVEDIKMQLHR